MLFRSIIPNYALWPVGSLCPTTYFYKDLRSVAQISVAQETPDQPEVIAFLEASGEVAADLYPADSNHMLDISELLKPEVCFYVARRDGVALGCGSLVISDGSVGELKRFYVSETARGLGVGHALLKAVEDYARVANIRGLRLETGIYSSAAIALYHKNGFLPRSVFAPYEPDIYSVFMEKIL